MHLVLAAETPDFAHSCGEPFDTALAFSYATGAPLHKGLSEENYEIIELPNTYNDAIQSRQREQWSEAIPDETESVKKHNVYKLVPIPRVPKTEKIIITRVVFKQEADGRFKARPVVQGHVQKAGVDYGRSYAPVYRIGSSRTLLAIACEHGWPVW